MHDNFQLQILVAEGVGPCRGPCRGPGGFYVFRNSLAHHTQTQQHANNSFKMLNLMSLKVRVAQYPGMLTVKKQKAAEGGTTPKKKTSAAQIRLQKGAARLGRH